MVVATEICNRFDTHCGMIEKLTPIDIGILVAAATMAVGAFCPIVYIPIIGSITYVMRGNGDGILVVLCAMAIVGLVLVEYRRTTGVVAGVALAIMLRAIIGFSSVLGNANADLDRSLKVNPFAGLAKGLVSSVSLGWGWVLLIGGAVAVIILAIISHAQRSPAPARRDVDQRNDGESDFVASADQRIAEYLENRKISPSHRAVPSQQSGFGKRART